MTPISDIIHSIEHYAPLMYQEKYDNSGIILGGDVQQQVTGVLCGLDCTLALLQEAVKKKCNLVLTHHPLIFGGVKKITDHTHVGQCIRYAIQHDLTLYALHTNYDNVAHGINQAIGQRLGLTSLQILKPKEKVAMLLTTFVPLEASFKLRNALHAAGAGSIGDYRCCSFTNDGTGRFKPLAPAKPSMGEKGVLNQVKEQRIEMMLPKCLVNEVVEALLSTHPYEAPVYYLQPLANGSNEVGSGMIGVLSTPLDEKAFLALLKQCFKSPSIRYTPTKKRIQKVALCGGSGSSLLPYALAQQADAFVTADVRYHTFFDARGKLLLADVGHHESEVIFQQHLQNFLTQQFALVPFFITAMSSNPIAYYYA